MKPLQSKVNLHSDLYKTNHDAMSAACARLQSELAKSRQGGGEKYNRRHTDAGKLLPRERIELLLDPDSYFLELCPLAGRGLPGVAPGASVVGGIGLIEGVECLVSASESTVNGEGRRQVLLGWPTLGEDGHGRSHR